TTIVCMRAPGMTMFRMPIFTWNILVTSILVLLAFPVLAAALLVVEIDRKLGSVVFSSANGGAILWQHLFWFFGHPEVYIVAIPFFGIATEVLPVFSRKPLFGYKGMIAATIAIAGLSMTVWAHHMFTTGAVLLPFFSFMTFLIAVPTGFHMTFLVQHWLGVMGMPRRIANYPDLEPLATTLNQISTIGSLILGASTLFFLYNVYKTARHGEQVTVDDPWGWGNSLEWATS